MKADLTIWLFGTESPSRLRSVFATLATAVVFFSITAIAWEFAESDAVFFVLLLSSGFLAGIAASFVLGLRASTSQHLLTAIGSIILVVLSTAVLGTCLTLLGGDPPYLGLLMLIAALVGIVGCVSAGFGSLLTHCLLRRALGIGRLQEGPTT